MTLEPTSDETVRRDAVMAEVFRCVREDRTIKLPDFDPEVSRPSPSAMVSVGVEPNPFGGQVGGYRYQFEGEEDLLHLFVTRLDGGPIGPEEAQSVADFVLVGLPRALIWLRPGEFSQHFYFGHDELLRPDPDSSVR